MPADEALAVVLFGLAGLALFATASLWIKAAREREAPDEVARIPVHAFRVAANATAASFYLLGVALLLTVLFVL